MEVKNNYLFGLVKVHVIVEDRDAKDISRNFKHQIKVYIFQKQILSAIIRSSTEGIYFVNSKEVV